MPTPRSGYYVNGERVPSVTTVIGRFKQAEDLLGWAFRLGKEGKDFRQEREAAAAIGTCAHSCIEYTLAGEPIPPTVASDAGVRPTDLQAARNAFTAWKLWRDSVNLVVHEQETSLVSTTHKFGGTFDAVATVDGKRMLCDWKSSNRLYDDYLCQLCAYHLLWSENRPDEPLDGALIVRLDKAKSTFETKSIAFPSDRATECTDVFLSMLSLYNQLKRARMLRVSK